MKLYIQAILPTKYHSTTFHAECVEGRNFRDCYAKAINRVRSLYWECRSQVPSSESKNIKIDIIKYPAFPLNKIRFIYRYPRNPLPL